MGKVFYHITTDLDHNGLFEPRIPKYMFEFENKTVPRICVSDSIQGCLSAFPDKDALGESQPRYIKVFEINTEELNLLPEDIINPELLYKSGYLDDALITNEHWIIKSFQVPAEKQAIYKIAWLEETGRLAVPYTVFREVKEKHEKEILEIKHKELLENDNEISFFNVMYFIEMNNNEYQREIINVSSIYDYALWGSNIDEAQDIYFSGNHTKELMKFVIENIPEAKIIQDFEGECGIHFPANLDITLLFLLDCNILTKRNMVKSLS